MGLEYNPGVVDRSGEIMAQGITGAASTVSDAIDKYTQMARQTKAYRQMAVDGLGMDPDEVDKMNLPQLQGKLQGAALKSSRAVQQLMMENEQLKNLALRREGVNDVATSQAMLAGLAPGSGGAPAANPQANPMAQPSFQDTANSGITLNPNAPNPAAMMGGPAPAGAAPASQPSAMMGGTVNDRIARALQTPGLNSRGMQEVVNAIRSTTPPAMLMQQGLGGDRVYGFGNKLHVVPGENQVPLGTSYPTAEGGSVVQTGPKSGAYVKPNVDRNAPDSVFGPDTKDAQTQFENDMKKFKAYDVKNFTAARKAHLVDTATETISTPQNNQWLYSDSDKEFRKGLSTLSNPHERDAALILRTKVKAASASNNLMQMLLGGAQPDAAAAAAPATAAAPAAAPVIRKYNPATGRIE